LAVIREPCFSRTYGHYNVTRIPRISSKIPHLRQSCEMETFSFLHILWIGFITPMAFASIATCQYQLFTSMILLRSTSRCA
jgi:hypothetical protein